MVHGARFANYSIEYQLVGSSTWEVLVPPCPPKGCPVKNGTEAARLASVKLYRTQRNGNVGDRPDGTTKDFTKFNALLFFFLHKYNCYLNTSLI